MKFKKQIDNTKTKYKKGKFIFVYKNIKLVFLNPVVEFNCLKPEYTQKDITYFNYELKIYKKNDINKKWILLSRQYIGSYSTILKLKDSIKYALKDNLMKNSIIRFDSNYSEQIKSKMYLASPIDFFEDFYELSKEKIYVNDDGGEKIFEQYNLFVKTQNSNLLDTNIYGIKLMCMNKKEIALFLELLNRFIKYSIMNSPYIENIIIEFEGEY